MKSEQTVTFGQVQIWLNSVAFDLRSHTTILNSYAHAIPIVIAEGKLTAEKEAYYFQSMAENLEQLWEKIDVFSTLITVRTPAVELFRLISQIEKQGTKTDREMVELRQVQNWLGTIFFDVKAPLSKLAACVALMHEEPELFSAEERKEFLQTMSNLAKKIGKYVEVIHDMEMFTSFVKNHTA